MSRRPRRGEGARAQRGLEGRSALDELRSDLGCSGADLSALELLSEREVERLLHGVQTARRRQREQLERALEHSQSFVPALLRGAVRRILFS